MSETQEVVIVEPKEFNIETAKAISIQSSFMPKLNELGAYTESYNQLIREEITPELVSRASDLRKRLVKVRTGIAAVHKTEKDFYLQAGRFVDALKNKLTLPVTQMEEKLSEVENYFEELRKKEIEEKMSKRRHQIADISEELQILDSEISGLSDEGFDMFLAGLKQRHDDKVAAEKKMEEERLERIRISELNLTRKDMLLPFWRFIDNKSENFGIMTDSEFSEFFNARKDDAAAYEKQQEKVRKENERLKAEAEKREKEQIEKEKIRNTRDELLRPYIVFIRKYNELIEKPENEFEKEFSDIKKGAQDHWDFEREEAVKKQKEEEAQRQKLIAEQAKAKKIEAELKAKKDAELAEQKRIDQEAARIKKEAEDLLKSGDKAILNNLIQSIEPIMMPEGLGQAGGITAAHIIDKQRAFIRWAQEQVNEL